MSFKNKADKSIFHINSINYFDDMEDEYYSSKEDPVITRHRESDVPINGTVVFFHSDPFSLYDGYVLEENNYINGKEGVSKIYEIELNYDDNDFPEETGIYYLAKEINYKNGLKNGDERSWWPNGNLKEVKPYVSGKVSGYFKKFLVKWK